MSNDTPKKSFQSTAFGGGRIRRVDAYMTRALIVLLGLVPTLAVAQCPTTIESFLQPMRSLLRPLCLAALAVAIPALAQPRECTVAGEKIHWIADYCMATLETDDEIAAGACINAEFNRVFTSDCEAKVHYKKAMCQRTIALKQRPDNVDNCLADKSFMGSTVRNGGVGGR